MSLGAGLGATLAIVVGGAMGSAMVPAAYEDKNRVATEAGEHGVLITGGGGSIGGELCRKLLDGGDAANSPLARSTASSSGVSPRAASHATSRSRSACVESR